MSTDLTLIKWKVKLAVWTLNRTLICNLLGHHWKRVELFPAECTRCNALLEQHVRSSGKAAPSATASPAAAPWSGEKITWL